MSRIKEPAPLQHGSILSIHIFEQRGLMMMHQIEFKLARIKDNTRDSKGIIFCYVDPTKTRFIHPSEVYRSNGLPRVKPEHIKPFTRYPEYKFIKYVSLIP